MRDRLASRIIIGAAGVTGLLFVYLFQRLDPASVIGADSQLARFIINRIFRFLLNDMFVIMLIYALFVERKYVLFAIWVQVLETVFLLVPYFIFKVYYPAYNGPLISYLHRLVLNPTLLLLLIPAFYYQRRQSVSAEK